jgi:hypothetical protein
MVYSINKIVVGSLSTDSTKNIQHGKRAHCWESAQLENDIYDLPHVIFYKYY